MKAKQVAKRVTKRTVAVVPAKPSYGEAAGLHSARDTLALKSRVALVIDQDTKEVLLQ